MREDLYNANGEYVKTVEWAEIQPTSDAPKSVTVDGTYEDEDIRVEARTGGTIMLTVTSREYGEVAAQASLLLDYEGRQALIRALQAL